MVRAVIVTGASRGFGRSVAVELAKRWIGSTFILTARDQISLEETQRLVLDQSPGSLVRLHQMDLGDMSSIQGNLQTLLDSVPREHTSMCLVNNAGSLGPLERISELADPSVIQAHLGLNVTSPMMLCSLAVRKAVTSGVPLSIVNVSSLAAVQPFDCWMTYCTSKAARDMLHRCVAEEAKQAGQNVRVLNYAPGPLDTEMQSEIRNDMPDVPLKDEFAGMHSEGKLLTADQSAHILGQLLEEDTYESGAHVDYYDVSKL